MDTFDDIVSRVKEIISRNLIPELALEDKSNYKKRAKHFQVYKYEKQFIRNMVLYPIIGRNFVRDFNTQFALELEGEFRRDFTHENLIAHYNLERKGLIKSYYATFLIDHVSKASINSISNIIKSGRYIYGYQGNFQATQILIRNIVAELYGKAYRDIAKGIVTANKKDGLDFSPQIEQAANSGLKFEIRGDVFSYIQPKTLVENSSDIYKDIKDELDLLQPHTRRIANQHPRLTRALAKYDAEIRRENPQLLNLFIYGGDIQSYLIRHRRELLVSNRDDAAPELAHELLDGLDAVLVLHAIIVLSSPEISDVVRRYEELQNLSLPVDISESPKRPFLNTVSAISAASKVFDEKTRALAQEIGSDQQSNSLDKPQEAAAAGVTRGTLAAIGKFAKNAAVTPLEEAISEEIKDSTKSVLKSEALRTAVKDFMANRATDIAELVARYPNTFGWAEGVLRFFLNGNGN